MIKALKLKIKCNDKIIFYNFDLKITVVRFLINNK